MKHLPRWRKHLRLAGVLWFMLIPHFVAPHSHAATQVNMLVKVWSGHYVEAVKIDPDTPAVNDRGACVTMKLRHGHHYPSAQIPEAHDQQNSFVARNDSDRDRPGFIQTELNAPLILLL